MSKCKPITYELREMISCFMGFTDFEKSKFIQVCDNIDSIYSALEAECEQYRDGWVELPKDKDGKYIHIGDMMKSPSGYVEMVEGILPDRYLVLRDGNWFTCHADWGRHCQPDTWERIIEDAIDAVDDCWANDEHDKLVDALVARCKALAGDAE